MNSGFIKVRAASPRVGVGGVQKNLENALAEIELAKKDKVKILTFPELYLSGYTCGDLFLQKALTDACMHALETICKRTENADMVICIGLPVRADNRLYNCAAVLFRGEILGFVPKTYIPNYGEYYEKRWFASGKDLHGEDIRFANQFVNCSINALFRFSDDIILGVEICEDLWVPNPPSTELALSGANIIVNLSASNEAVTKNDYRKSIIAAQSAKCFCAYVYASAGVGESSTDLVFSGACTIAENGAILAEGERFAFDGSRCTADIDIDKLNAERIRNGSFFDAKREPSYISVNWEETEVSFASDFADVTRTFDPHPFVPSNTGLKKAVIGISGGLDSTLALLVSVRAMEILHLPAENILCVTMPGFGTTDRTYHNAVALIKAFGAQFLEIPIRDAAMQHMKDIGHDPQIHDITYENTQARERTQILMDLANRHGGILVGTGDLSELALGWCTYNADHMSMYGVNAGVPKTLVRHLVENEAEHLPKEIADILYDVLDTPVSPELLPPDENGKIQQKTEDTLGPYEVHDFYLYHFLRFGTRPEKMLFMASRAFSGVYTEEQLKRWLRLFIKRFFNNQFKRSCLPDGPKVGSVSLSPRGDWRMPSDADMEIWLAF